VSQENVAIARRAMEAFNAGDVEAATAEMAADVEWRPLSEMTHGDVLVGIDAVQRFWRDWTETFDDFRLVIEGVSEAPAGAIAVTRAAGRGATSGLEMTGDPFFQVFEIRDGEVRSLRMLRTREEALEAAGLNE
jgi:ketosteroid isomerase-like protein